MVTEKIHLPVCVQKKPPPKKSFSKDCDQFILQCISHDNICDVIFRFLQHGACELEEKQNEAFVSFKHSLYVIYLFPSTSHQVYFSHEQQQ